MLVSFGANVNIVGNFGLTALISAAEMKASKLVEVNIEILI